MTDKNEKFQNEADYGDPLTRPFWEAARRHELVMQHCQACTGYQFYPRPFCLKCDSTRLEWQVVSGQGIIYSLTTVRIAISTEFEPPYQTALVDLAEGPRLLTRVISPEAKIGDVVQLCWQERAEAPPLPVFKLV